MPEVTEFQSTSIMSQRIEASTCVAYDPCAQRVAYPPSSVREHCGDTAA